MIWSGNFIIARSANDVIPPVALAFYRWVLATLIILPFALKKIKAEWPAVKRSIAYLFWASLTGIALFNTFVYIAGHYTEAINLALIGTTSSPVMAIIFARIFLKEKIGWLKLAGVIICIIGVLYLLCRGDFNNLFHFNFTEGDGWVLLGAFCFAVYNTLAKRKPKDISHLNFLFVTFFIGTVLLLPFYIWEYTVSAPVQWNSKVLFTILYLSLGASVICFFIWNKAIEILGAGRTALFGNLIPIFSSFEAVIILHEDFSWVHVISMLIVFAGLLLANIKLKRS